MRHDRVAPNTITFSATNSVCEKGMQWKHALELLREMWHDSVAPDTITFSAAISACETSMQWQQALELLSKLVPDRVAPDPIAFNAASVLARRERIEACVGALARDVA